MPPIRTRSTSHAAEDLNGYKDSANDRPDRFPVPAIDRTTRAAASLRHSGIPERRGAAWRESVLDLPCNETLLSLVIPARRHEAAFNSFGRVHVTCSMSLRTQEPASTRPWPSAAPCAGRSLSELRRFGDPASSRSLVYHRPWMTVPLCSVVTVALALAFIKAPRSSAQFSMASCKCLTTPAGDS
jgi:hypothetical protein